MVIGVRGGRGPNARRRAAMEHTRACAHAQVLLLKMAAFPVREAQLKPKNANHLLVQVMVLRPLALLLFSTMVIFELFFIFQEI